MDYYEKFKAKLDTKTKELAETFGNLTSRIPKAKKRLADEVNNLASLEGRITKLKELSGESLTGDAHSFEKYKTSLKKLNTELDISKELVRSLTAEILPKMHTELSEAKTNLKIKLDAFVIQSRPIADEKINELLETCINERQAFLDAFDQIYEDYGLPFVVNNESFCPGIWAADELEDLKRKL